MKFTPQHLTPGEKFHLHFRRSGLSCKQLAEVYEVSDRTVKNWMKDKGKVPFIDIREIKPWEACYIINRRSGVSYRTLARTIGIRFTHVDAYFTGKATYNKVLNYFKKLGWEFE